MTKLTNPCSEIPLGSIGGITCSPDTSYPFEPGEGPRRGDIFTCYEGIFVLQAWIKRGDRIMIIDVDRHVVGALVTDVYVKMSIYTLFEFFGILTERRR